MSSHVCALPAGGKFHRHGHFQLVVDSVLLHDPIEGRANLTLHLVWLAADDC
jgi:hypothetical protein